MAPLELFITFFLYGLWFKLLYAIYKDCEKVIESKIVAHVLKVFKIYFYCELMNKVIYETQKFMATAELFIAVFLHGLWFKMLYAISKVCEKVNDCKIVAPVLKVFEIYFYSELINKVIYKSPKIMATAELFIAVFLHGLWFKMLYAISKVFETVNWCKIVMFYL